MRGKSLSVELNVQCTEKTDSTFDVQRMPFEPILTFPRPAPISSRRKMNMEAVLQRAPPKRTMGRKFVRSMKRALASTSALPPLALAKG